MPSCTSTKVSVELEASMDSTPLEPTLSSAAAIISPTNSSFPEEMVATFCRGKDNKQATNLRIRLE